MSSVFPEDDKVTQIINTLNEIIPCKKKLVDGNKHWD